MPMNHEPSSKPQGLTRRHSRKKPSLGVRILRFLFSLRPRHLLILLAMAVVLAGIGFGIFVAVCNRNASWTDLPSPDDDTIPPLNDTETGPFGDGFLTDMSAFEPYINPIGDKRDVFLRLVSKKTPFKRGDAPTDLVTVPPAYTWDGREIEMSEYAAKALEAMLTEMLTSGLTMKDPISGLPIRVLSGYRSYDEQKQLFENEVTRQLNKDPSLSRELAEDIASAIVDRPGTNEHQSGLAVAFAAGTTAGASFADTAEYEWLAENAWKFGFILRYPEGKESETGSAFRPYHFRFVGRPHASLMQKNNLCLEEYLKVVVLDGSANDKTS